MTWYQKQNTCTNKFINIFKQYVRNNPIACIDHWLEKMHKSIMKHNIVKFVFMNTCVCIFVVV